MTPNWSSVHFSNTTLLSTQLHTHILIHTHTRARARARARTHTHTREARRSRKWRDGTPKLRSEFAPLHPFPVRLPCGCGQQLASAGAPGTLHADELVTMPITRPDWPANGLFFAFSRPLAEGWPGNAGRWPKILVPRPSSTLHCSITSLELYEALVTREREKKSGRNALARSYALSWLMLCNDYKPLQGVVSSGITGGNQRTLWIISGLSLVRCGDTRRDGE